MGVLWAVLATAHGAPVTWTGPTETVSEASISLNGTLYHAGTWGTGAGTGPLAVPVGSETIVFENMVTGAAIGINNAVASGGEFYDAGAWVPTGTANANFDAVMDGFAPDGANPKSVIVGGLVAGKTYQVQLFVSDDRGCCGGRTMEWSDNATDGAGNETTTFAMNTSPFVIGTFTADGPTQTFYGRGVAQTQNGVNAYIVRDLNPDTDGDQIPDHVEDSYPFLNKNDNADAALDQDNDGLSNLVEYRKRLLLDDNDFDNDGLSDGLEVNTYNTNPRVTDTDGDGLSDGAEVNTHHSSPTSLDSDGDFFPDGYEAQAGTALDSAASTPNNLVITNLGTGTGALLDFDLTDPENDGSDATAEGSGFNWVSVTSNGAAALFSPGESAANVFDNKVGGGEMKWCCGGNSAPQNITVEFSQYTSLQYFTITSSNDAPERDPRVWEIQGSNDGLTFAPIVRINYTGGQIWTARNQVLQIALPTRSLPYKFIRYQSLTTGSGNHALGELEYFGLQNNADADADLLPKLYEDLYPAILSDAVASDAALDSDNDGLSNLEEFQRGTKPDDDDTDDDGLKDGLELDQYFTNPFVADTDGDGLSDGAEVNGDPVHNFTSDPTLADTDGDLFKDGYEVAQGSDPDSDTSTPYGVSVSLAAGLLQRDITDRNNDGSDATLTGSGFDWVSITASSKADFSPAEGAFNVFDNKVGGGEAKWCCDPAPQSITVQMPYGVQLTHFTLTSSNDSPERDPRVFAIQGSNDGVTFTDIFNHTDASGSFFGTARNQTVQFTLATPAPTYRWFRYAVTAAQSTTQHALGEIEYFGIDQDSDSNGLPDYWEALYGITDPGGNPDNDGLTNLQEFTAGTHPTNSDTDNDGLQDGAEVNTHNTNPTLADSDNDQIADGYEIAHSSDPNDSNSLPVFPEVTWGSPANITGTLADFQTGGLLVNAWTGGATAVNIPDLGINFQPGYSLGARFTGFDPFTRTASNADYENLLNSGSFSGSPRFVEFTGLTVGEQYRIQIWVADTRAGANKRFEFDTYDLTSPRVELSGGTGDFTSNSGQFVTGTFTATDTRHYIYVNDPDVPGSQYNAITLYQTTGIPENLVVTATSFNGAAFELHVQGFDTTKSYKLRRSTDLINFNDVGTPFTPTSSSQVVTDPAPPAGKAFYKIQDVP
ncbi:discoidin domain-containing protein [Luteolibacter luteus]|uniref:Discoidin domain-containing protein n=1 Tax=Luteolibacter luteus TaxID=2728835 RepID=A0A858RLT8_9BACT|nr:discoidin domain-containing protein [Luteolibacter luteus]QJE97464.1 discoidin domain-containing protein [Luteolibacter luteus]